MGFRSFGQIIDIVRKIEDFGHKLGKGFGKRVAHPHPIFLGVPPVLKALRRQLMIISQGLSKHGQHFWMAPHFTSMIRNSVTFRFTEMDFVFQSFSCVLILSVMSVFPKIA